MEHTVRDNPDRQRYELVVGDEIVSIADYHLRGDSVVVPHVETNPAHRGQGNADRLMAGMLDDLRVTGRTIVPLCPFAADYIEQHPDQQDLLTPR
ncbi:MAG: GNAT family N-acetyltransferase [Actinomycetota bacterium]